jgi:hypothetical protein
LFAMIAPMCRFYHGFVSKIQPMNFGFRFGIISLLLSRRDK